MIKALAHSMILLAALALPQFLALPVSAGEEPSAVQADASKDSAGKFSGTWEGKCQDGRTFVVVALQMNGSQIGGTVSIGNMHGDNEGACMLVTAPPVPEHAQKISDPVAQHDVLSFHGSQRPDGTFSRLEFKETAKGKAELKLLDTPVEEHPWQLVNVQKPE
jgi:hypothetical protein